jgi:hypothetical protein
MKAARLEKYSSAGGGAAVSGLSMDRDLTIFYRDRGILAPSAPSLPLKAA